MVLEFCVGKYPRPDTPVLMFYGKSTLELLLSRRQRSDRRNFHTNLQYQSPPRERLQRVKSRDSRYAKKASQMLERHFCRLQHSTTPLHTPTDSRSD
ncbi:hypothetical protein TNCV_3025301 [Trichonephila clavipes]|nr:hypothetical protein TNCV_3025301 [Trichonephila clavipes]